jgi:hypothetical protein
MPNNAEGALDLEETVQCVRVFTGEASWCAGLVKLGDTAEAYQSQHEVLQRVSVELGEVKTEVDAALYAVLNRPRQPA